MLTLSYKRRLVVEEYMQNYTVQYYEIEQMVEWVKGLRDFNDLLTDLRLRLNAYANDLGYEEVIK